ncbi:hypothetical protein QBC43DRAFT_319544, partial [Cladorrhinum sp. PSN259]
MVEMFLPDETRDDAAFFLSCRSSSLLFFFIFYFILFLYIIIFGRCSCFSFLNSSYLRQKPVYVYGIALHLYLLVGRHALSLRCLLFSCGDIRDGM